VNIVGTAEAGAVVQLVGTPVQATADATGHVTLTNVPLQIGVNTFQVLTTDRAGNQVTSQFTVTSHDTDAPVITLNLVKDTGGDATDGITNDPTVRAVVDDASQVTMLQASLNGGPYVNVLSSLQGDVLVLNDALLQTINGGPLADNQYQL